MQPPEEMADVVDENDVVVGVASRSEIRARKLLHRGVEMIVRDAAGRIFVHRRPKSKDVYPDRFVIAIGGMVASGETYEEAARRELKEELGIADTSLKPLFKEANPDPENPHWKMTYEIEWEGQITPDPSEISEGRFVEAAELPALLDEPGLEYQRRLLARITGER